MEGIKGLKTESPEQAKQGEVLQGVDELNLAEFPLAAISQRLETKTVVFDDEVFDRDLGRSVPRRLTLSGSDRYGLPTAADDDVLLACIQISKLGNFSDPKVIFSRYEILKLLGWRDETRNYRRVAESLRRWKGLTVYSDKAFFDKKASSWVNRDFGIIDNLSIYRRESAETKARSHFTWNEVIFQSFQAGYLKQLDWSLYCKLKSPVAKRLYRFLDKRFYHRSRIEIDLRILGTTKVRLSSDYNTAQMKRALDRGIAELEHLWCLKRTKDRYQKVGKGNWIVVFEQKRATIASVVKSASNIQLESNLSRELTKRGVGPATADELTTASDQATVRTMIELFDWYNERNQSRGAGFLVHAIKNSSSIIHPAGFESSIDGMRRREAQKNRISTAREKLGQREAKQQEAENVKRRAFLAAWERLDFRGQEAFENEALGSSPPLTVRQYRLAKNEGSTLFEKYRMIVLIDHFNRLTDDEHERWFGSNGALPSLLN